ncbi:tyrosine-type recombinase/integrase [Parerythrobacter lacustris]|uniref:Site-specific integrase n=1 Tax=Parerythrobacter lacustris TaxID=2969984 RepID=A0ABT1XL51_9SPHN|nr:site-specific integrase [Parerythrobacter lacustris]MCR2832391.1 site-specific integrase [Parerythrobacter lacustris]
MTTADITARHKLLDGKVQLYIRAGSPHWQCSCTIAGRQKRTTTKEESLARAKDVARDWYLSLLGKYRQGELREGTPFTKAADQFVAEYGAIMEGERNAHYIKSQSIRLRVHLIPFFGDKMVAEITPGLVQEYRAHRMKTGVARDGKTPQRPARNTLHQEIITLRHVLKTAERHGWLPYLPNISAPYKASGKVSHRAWFSPEEYKQLYKATSDRAKNPKRERWRSACEDLHDYVLFMVNSGLRPDEALRVEVRDVEVAIDGPDKQRILHITVRGKRGVGYCKTMPGAVLPFQRMVKRHGYKPTDLLFPTIQRELFNTILDELGLKKDREGNARTTYSLRHTYISFRLIEGADIYQVAKNCRTSVEMIEKYYASHIKDMIDAGAINTRRPKK